MKKFTPVPSAAFTLIELLVSTTIIALIMLVMVSMTNQTTKTWRATTEKVEKFQGARDGFEAMTRRISQATLNTYWDYVDVSGKVRSQFLAAFPNDNSALSKFVPVSYGRMSELRFASGPMSLPDSPLVSNAGTPPLNPLVDQSTISDLKKFPTHGIFFQAPLGVVTDDTTSQTMYGNNYTSMDNLLNTWGYFVETGDYDERPAFITSKITPLRWRCRLMEMRLPSEKMGLYDAFSTDKSNDWFQTWLAIPNGNNATPRPVKVLAENVMALIIWPKLSKQDEDLRWNTAAASTSQSILCPNYAYTSNPQNDPATQRPYNRCPGVVWNSITTDDVVEKGGVNPLNQLPPTVQVTMIAIDERSAKRLAELYGPSSSTPANKYTLGFDISKRFLTAAHYNRDKGGTYSDMSVTTAPFNRAKYESYMDQDIDEYCLEMAAKGVTFRVFSTNVSIRGAKWSRAQF